LLGSLSWVRFLRREGASQPRRDADCQKQTGRRTHIIDLLRLALAAQIHSSHLESGQLLKSLRLCLIGKIHVGADEFVSAKNVGDSNQSLRVWVRQRIEYQRVDHAEDRGVRSDAQRQREHGDEGEARTSPQHPQAIPQILNERLDKSYSAHIVMSLLEQCDVSQLAARGPGGIVLGHPLADLSLGEQAQVRLDLVVEISIRSAISEQSSKSCCQGAQIVGHLYS